MALPLTTLTTLPDEALRARLRRAALERMEAEAPLGRARAGQACIELMTELKRRGVPLWSDPGAPCACGCTPQQRSPWQVAAPGPMAFPVLATG